MQTTRLKICLDALANENREIFAKKIEEFKNDIDQGLQRYSEDNLLIFGPLYRIDSAFGNFGCFSIIIRYLVLTTAKPNREVMLPKKDRTSAEKDYLENEEEVQELTKKLKYEVAAEIMKEGLGKSLNGDLK